MLPSSLPQVLWLVPAYLLEFQGYNTFVAIWLAGVTFFLVNVYILVVFMRHQSLVPVFKQGSIVATRKLNHKQK